MAPRNVELHRRANDAFNSRDVEAYVAYCDPEIVLHSAVTVPGGAVYHGHDGSFHVLRGRGLHSRAGVATPAAHVCRWRDGRIVYFKGYLERTDALRDLGLSEDSAEAFEP